MGIAEELWKSTMVSFPDELPATLGGYILVYKKKQESDNFVSKVRFKIRLCEVLISFLRVYSVIFFCGKFPRVNSGKIVWFAYIWNQSFEISHYSIKQHHEALVFQKYSLISFNYLLNIEMGQNRIIFAKSRFGPSPKWELKGSYTLLLCLLHPAVHRCWHGRDDQSLNLKQKTPFLHRLTIDFYLII